MLIKKPIITLIFIFCFGGIVFGQTDNNDVQFWNQNSIEFPLNKESKKVSGVILTDTRLTNDVSDLTDIRVGFGVKYKANKYLTLQPTYMFRVDTVLENNTKYEHHLMFDITPGKTFKNFSLDNRSRFEHRIKNEGAKDTTFYRNRTRLRIPVKKENKTIFTPFIWNDTWFDIQKGNVLRNDAAAGITGRFNKNTAADFYYLYRRNIQAGTTNEHVIGVNFNFNIK